MRTRTKIRLGLLIFIAFLLTIAAVYLLALPALPTGYDEIARLRQADIQTDSESATSSTAPSRSGSTSISTSTSTTLSSSLSSSSSPSGSPSTSLSPALPSAPETPRQRFLRCWAALVRHGQESIARSMQEVDNKPSSSSPLALSCKRVEQLASDAYTDMVQNEHVLRLTPQEWSAIEAHGDATSSAYQDAVRQFVSSRLARELATAGAPASYLNEPPGMYGGRSQSPRDVRRRVQEAAQAEPLQAAAELLRLPAGAVPLFPAGRLAQSNRMLTQASMTPLTQAFLHALLHDPDFDAAAALCRLREIRDYLQRAAYPSVSYWEPNYIFRTIAHAMHYARLTQSRQLTALAAGFSRMEPVDAQYTSATLHHLDQLRRYQAACVRDSLLERLEPCLGGAGNSGNAFHYLYDGKVESLWLRANAANVRRHIDLLAVALARGDDDQVDAARRSLQRVMTLANIAWEKDRELMGEQPLLLPPRSGASYSPEIVKVALAAWLQDHGRLPDRISDLAPAYLETAWLASLGSVWWLDTHDAWPALVRVTVSRDQVARDLQAAARDPRTFREAMLKRVEQDLKGKADVFKTRQMIKAMSDAQLEEVRQRFLAPKNLGATLYVSWSGFPVESPSPSPSAK